MKPHHPRDLTEMNRIHEELEDLFFRHQRALLKRDYDLAANLLETYEAVLFAHMKEESEILLPIYQERAGQLRGGKADIFIGEHKRIVEWLNRLKLRLKRVHPSPEDDRGLLALLDDEAQYKKFLEHHTLREDRIFYPEVERVVTDSERKGLLRLLTFTLDTSEP